MARLFRPHIPLEVRCRVVLRQLGEMFVGDVIAYNIKRRTLGALLANRLRDLAVLVAAEKFHLDHDPPLGARQRKGEGKNTKYFPDANDPSHLIYREKHAHHIKTNVRGDGAQHPDRVLIKRERRWVAKKSAKKQKRRSVAKLKHRWPKGRKIPSRKMRT